MAALLILCFCWLGGRTPDLKDDRAAIPGQFEAVTLKHIMDAWKAAQDRVRTGRFEWREKKTFAKGSLNSLSAPPDRGIIPSADTVLDIQSAMVLDGDRVRYATDGPHWSSRHNRFLRQRYVSVFNGITAKSFWPPDSIVAPEGSVARRNTHLDRGCLYLLALTLAYRPFCPSISAFDRSGCTLSSVSTTADGRSHIIIGKNHPEGRTEEWWTDPCRQFIPFRYVERRDGKTIVDLQMSYEQDETGNWNLVSWKSTWYGPSGAVRESCDAMITQHAINIEVDAKEFDIEFPVGTVLADLNTGLRFIVRAGGNRMITRDELLRGASYQELVASESGRAGLPGFPWPLFVGINALAFTGLILLWWWQRRGSSRDQRIERRCIDESSSC